MATIDRTWQDLGIGNTRADYCELPQLMIEEMLGQGTGRRAQSSSNRRPGSGWIRDMFAEVSSTEAFVEEVDVVVEETVLRSDEVTRDAISFASGPVAIEITDEQATQLKRFRSGGCTRAE